MDTRTPNYMDRIAARMDKHVAEQRARKLTTMAKPLCMLARKAANTKAKLNSLEAMTLEFRAVLQAIDELDERITDACALIDLLNAQEHEPGTLMDVHGLRPNWRRMDPNKSA